MKNDQVSRLSLEKRFLYWIKERYSIYLKREAGKPRPWTDDEILQQYRFCNVRRMDDKVSQWFLKNWYLPWRGHKNMVLAAVLARQFNNPAAMEAVGFPEVWNPRRVEKILSQRMEEGLQCFNRAYIITGSLGGTKIQQVVWKVATPIYKSGIRVNTSSLQETWKRLLPFAGFGSFIAGQVSADLRWAIDGTWKDAKLWAPIGPGSRKGMNRILRRSITSRLGQPEFQALLGRLVRNLQGQLPKSLYDRLEAMDIQNCLCEFDKYSRGLEGVGRPKQKYPKKGDAKEYGVKRSHDLPWDNKKARIFRALKKLGATRSTNACSTQDVAAKAEVTSQDVRHYCYHAMAAQLVGIVKQEGIRGYAFHLTAKGAKTIPNSEFAGPKRSLRIVGPLYCS